MHDEHALPPLAVGELYAHHFSWLSGWLRRQLGCPHNAADLAHDTFLRLLGGSEPLGLRDPKAFLATIARGLVIDHWRRQALERAYLDAFAQDSTAEAPSPEAQLLILELLAQIDALLDGLRPRVRSAFLMAQLDGLTYREIAVQLAVSERMVKKYMAQAMLHCLLLRTAAQEQS